MEMDINVVLDVPDEYVDMTLDELESMDTLIVGQADDLKIDDGRFRVWLSRVGVDDGMPYDNAVTIETVVEGAWLEVCMYEAL